MHKSKGLTLRKQIFFSMNWRSRYVMNSLLSLECQWVILIYLFFYPWLQPPKKMTAAQKSLAKVDKTGMKPLSSFFSPKVKAEKKWLLYSLWFCILHLCNKEMEMYLTVFSFKIVWMRSVTFIWLKTKTQLCSSYHISGCIWQRCHDMTKRVSLPLKKHFQLNMFSINLQF